MKKFGKFFNCFTPMTQLILVISGHLGKGLVIALGYKDRIIAKTGFSFRFQPDMAFGVSNKCYGFFIRENQRHAAYKLSATLFTRYALKFGQELFVISDVAPIVASSGITGRVDTGSAIEGIDFEP